MRRVRTQQVLGSRLCEQHLPDKPRDKCVSDFQLILGPIFWEVRKIIQRAPYQPDPPQGAAPWVNPALHSAQRFRTAVCFTGELRALNMRPGNSGFVRTFPHPWVGPEQGLFAFSGRPYADLRWRFDLQRMGNMSAAETIRRRLYPALGDFDVFVAISTREEPQDPVAGDTSVCESLRPTGSPKSRFECDVYKKLVLPRLPMGPLLNPKPQKYRYTA